MTIGHRYTAFYKRVAIVSALFVAGCGGSPTSPGPNPQPTTVTIAGRVTTTLTGEPVAGATLNFSGRTVTTSINGNWNLDGQEKNTTLTVEVTAAGFLTRSTRVKTENGRADITIDLIRDGGEFSLGFYRQLVRNAHDAPDAFGTEPLRRWTVNPNVYLQSPPAGADLGGIESLIRSIVAQASGGTLSVGLVTTGTAPQSTQNTISIAFSNDPSNAQCGTAQIGANPGVVNINTGRCVCDSSSVNTHVLAHELTHAMGFRHTADGLMKGSGSGCGTGALSATEIYHARIAYARQPGNMDVDRDASSTTFFSAPSRDVTVTCYRR
jgi:hypothetical protein